MRMPDVGGPGFESGTPASRLRTRFEKQYPKWRWRLEFWNPERHNSHAVLRADPVAPMKVVFDDDRLDRLYTDPAFTNGLPASLVKNFRMRMQSICAAPDERDFYNQKSLHYEKLKGNRQHQRSMRLNRQFRLVGEVEDDGAEKRLRIVGIEDYH